MVCESHFESRNCIVRYARQTVAEGVPRWRIYISPSSSSYPFVQIPWTDSMGCIRACCHTPTPPAAFISPFLFWSVLLHMVHSQRDRRINNAHISRFVGVVICCRHTLSNPFTAMPLQNYIRETHHENFAKVRSEGQYAYADSLSTAKQVRCQGH